MEVKAGQGQGVYVDGAERCTIEIGWYGSKQMDS